MYLRRRRMTDIKKKQRQMRKVKKMKELRLRTKVEKKWIKKLGFPKKKTPRQMRKCQRRKRG